MASLDDKSMISARVVKTLIKKVDVLRLKQNRNRSQMLEWIIVFWYFDNYKKKNKDFTADFSKYFNPAVEKNVVSVRLSNDCIKRLDVECKSTNRNRSQILECIVIQYLTDNKLA